MSRQHLAVCVHIDASALCLLEQVFQVMHVMATDEDGLALGRGQLHLGRYRMTKPNRNKGRDVSQVPIPNLCHVF